MNKKLTSWGIRIIFLLIILLGVAILSLSVGPAGIPATKIISIILEGRGSAEYSIIFDIRLPRILLGFAIGGALSLSGVILQGMFRNPLVEPYTLGISGGAALGVALSIILGLYKVGVLTLPLFGFLGASLVIMLVYLLSIRRGALRIQELLLTGVMISFISSSLIMFIMAISRIEDLHGIVFWIMGSLEESNWFLIKATVLVSIISLIISYQFCHALNAFSLGEEEALHLGIDVEQTKRLLFILASFLTGFSVSVAGIIGFVGLVVPHFVRLLLGSDHRILLAGSFLAGGTFLIFCDTLARTVISPLELPVGVITGILGGSLFVYVLTKRQVLLGGK
jgi:iron complex transport system permease protein